jgi:hypothetical protein
MSTSTTPRKPPIVTLLALIPAALAALLWLALVATLVNLHSSDAAGNGLAQVYAVVNIVALWALLLVTVIIAMAGDGGPGWMKACAALLTLASAAAAIAAFTLLTGRGHDGVRWVAIVPIVIPPLLIAYALWAFIPALRGAVPIATVALALGLPALVLSLTPWVVMAARMGGKMAHVSAAPAPSVKIHRT